MIKEMLKGRIQVKESAVSWEEAIRISAEPMLAAGCIEECYIEQMIGNVIQNGPYIVIMPGVAMPHAKPETGVNRNGISLLKLKQAILFPEEKEVTLILALAANNPEEHLDLISEVTDLLIDEEKMERLFGAVSTEEIMEIL